ncbi:hypothetical protein [Bacillus sp. AFS041924]|uniref:hypothetical protein n=1 Tax=Bacillus sp. AFS041924 TaxID=2033503 RepID=UPI000BFC3532|nr:hypothetical protein [Bacillus sp. AFS041924]PGS53442.1 hypothetical protein COC46_07440 [Bacillus sp. AFS041924]
MKGNNPISEIKHICQKNLDEQNPSVTFHQVWSKANSNQGNKRFQKPFVSVVIVLFLAFSIFNIFPIKNELMEAVGDTKVNESTSADDSIGLLIVNGIEYRFDGVIKNKEYTFNNQIGIVHEVVKDRTILKDNFSSNMLSVGDKIYTTNEDTKVIIVEQENGTIFKFSKTD